MMFYDVIHPSLGLILGPCDPWDIARVRTTWQPCHVTGLEPKDHHSSYYIICHWFLENGFPFCHDNSLYRIISLKCEKL